MHKENTGVITLKAQHSYMLAVAEDYNVIFIKVFSGKLRFNHDSYSPDGRTWLDPPSGGQNAHYNYE